MRPVFVSIIIPVLNSQKTLEDSILSVISQTYNFKELIIIDGGSTDDSIEVIKKYSDSISYWCSEKDRGISHAFNKGYLKSKGDYIYFLGAGDLFENNQILSLIFDSLNKDFTGLIAGKIRRVDSLNTHKTLWVSSKPFLLGKFLKISLLFRMSLHHQGLFTHRSFFEKFGLFDESIIYAMDYELLLRAYHEFPPVKFYSIIIAKWRADGLGTSKEEKIYEEYLSIKIMNKIAPIFILNWIDSWTKVKFYLKNKILIYAK